LHAERGVLVMRLLGNVRKPERKTTNICKFHARLNI
jgi:hypothetical protein